MKISIRSLPSCYERKKEENKSIAVDNPRSLPFSSWASCPIVRRKIRNVGWWDRVWITYDESRFKETFRVTRGTFLYILNEIRSSLTKETFIEDPKPLSAALWCACIV